MTITELIEEAEKPVEERTLLRGFQDIHRSRTLLPLLVAVIKNQQRQIVELKDGLGDMLDGESQCYRRDRFESVHRLLADLAAELEDVKP